ncbi:hypothetical protein MHU86_2919 [Fragilaria crotonensis]|nr:hypothetical protein MHU86_2919 [Fragilaria crotonensis]
MPSDPPKITMDPRWKAARALVQSGHSQGAVDMFATLVEETIARYSETSLEAAVCYYEYGNALLRSVPATDTSDNAAGETQAQEQQEQDSKPPAVQHDDNNNENKEAKINEQDGNSDPKVRPGNDDFLLALEMMENAYSIFEEKATIQPKNEWIQYQLPRVLQGLGDVLRELGRMSDAADAYSRALPYREEFVEKYNKETDLTIEHLASRRLLVEANILVAEALLGCEHGKHVVTSETKDMLVTADERVDYARGYYEKAREELQETVFLMGKIAASGRGEELVTEKENICFAATLLMGVGETLATFDEEQEKSMQPPTKKVKTAL